MLPAMEACEIVSAHDPDEADLRTATRQILNRVIGVARADLRFDPRHNNARMIPQFAGGLHSGLKRRQSLIFLQRITGRHQPPDLVEPQPLQGDLADEPMTLMGRIKGAAKEPNLKPRLNARQAHGRAPALGRRRNRTDPATYAHFVENAGRAPLRQGGRCKRVKGDALPNKSHHYNLYTSCAFAARNKPARRPIRQSASAQASGLGVVRLHFKVFILNPLFAILIDGGFVKKKLFTQLSRHATAEDILTLCAQINNSSQLANYELLRIYYYDAPPSNEAITHPVSRKRLNLAATERFRLSQSLFDQLSSKPHVAMRMGETRLGNTKWRIKPRVAAELMKEPRQLCDDDFDLDISQKGVDMRIGLDIARLALRETVRAIVVITGDSDFVPAFKFARREGVKVYLETLNHNVRPELRTHADLVLS